MTTIFTVTLAMVLCLVPKEAWSRSSAPNQVFCLSIRLAERVPERSSNRRADYEKVRLAIKLSELQDILREPGRDVFSKDFGDIPGSKFVSAAPEGTRIYMRSGGNWETGVVDNAVGKMWCWCSPEAFLLVRLDRDSRVTDFMLFTHKPEQ
jgi:hypothetical protein